jgi:hypothetical protein
MAAGQKVTRNSYEYERGCLEMVIIEMHQRTFHRRVLLSANALNFISVSSCLPSHFSFPFPLIYQRTYFHFRFLLSAKSNRQLVDPTSDADRCSSSAGLGFRV